MRAIKIAMKVFFFLLLVVSVSVSRAISPVDPATGVKFPSSLNGNDLQGVGVRKVGPSCLNQPSTSSSSSSSSSSGSTWIQSVLKVVAAAIFYH